MKRRTLSALLIVTCLLLLALTACGGEKEDEHAGEAQIPIEDFVGKNYEEAVQAFEANGFTNVTINPIDDLITGWMTKDGEVESVYIGGNSEFTSGTWVPDNTEVVITYHTFKNETEASEETDQENQTEEADEPEQLPEETSEQEQPQEAGNITVDSNADFATILTSKECSDADYDAFAKNNIGKTVEFDGSIDYIENYKDYNTRFNMLLSAGPYDANSQIGPTFKFENVSSTSFDAEGNVPETYEIGQNVHIIAKVVGFDENTSIFQLSPITLMFP